MRVSTFKKKARTQGFTVVELLIATAVFSAVLLVSLIGFLQIGQIFYKGVTAARTHETTKDTMNSLASDIRFAAAISQSNPQPTGSGTSQYFCAGSHRYTFNPGRMVDRADYDNTTRFGLIRDTLPVSGSCASPIGPSGTGYYTPEELLGNRMRVSDIGIQRLTGSGLDNLYTISVKIAYGDNSVLQNTADSDPTNDTCDSGLRTSQYCHVSVLKTTVRRGVKQ